MGAGNDIFSRPLLRFCPRIVELRHGISAQGHDPLIQRKILSKGLRPFFNTLLARIYQARHFPACHFGYVYGRFVHPAKKAHHGHHILSLAQLYYTPNLAIVNNDYHVVTVSYYCHCARRRPPKRVLRLLFYFFRPLL